MHAARFSTYPLVREEIRSIITARDTLTGPAPMDVSAVYKGQGKVQREEGQRQRQGQERGEGQGEGSRDEP